MRDGHGLAVLSVALASVLVSVPSIALEDAGNGKRLAMQWCAACHLAAPEQTNAMAGVPPFATIAKKSDEALEGLKALLAGPHPKMPNMSLTRQEIADIVAYIRTLRKGL